MKKYRIIKSVLKKLHRKKEKRTAQTIGKVERIVRSSLLSQAQALAQEIREVEQELIAFPQRVTQQWLWLGDLKRVGYMMEEVVEVLEGPETVMEPDRGTFFTLEEKQEKEEASPKVQHTGAQSLP